MNWSKAKTILIIVFLLADIFLFYVSYSGDLGYNSGNDSVAQVLEHLENRDIIVKGLIPNKGNPGSQLYVKYTLFNPERAKKIFFNSDTDVFIRENENKIILENNHITVEIFKNGEIVFLNKSINNAENSEINESQAERIIDDFLKSLNIDRDDTIIINKVIEDRSINIMYNQVYKNQFIDKTFLDIKVTNNGVAYMKMLWFESIENGKTKSEVIPPTKALLKLSEFYREMEGTIIVEDISQGYYFGSNIEQPFDVQSIEEGTAIPVWRISTNMGSIYINAYNGTIEENF